MRAGSLEDEITIQSLGQGQDAFGQPIESWTTFATVPAEIRDVSGREYLAAQATQNTVQTVITIRVLNGVKPSMRVIHGDDVYSVEAVLRRKKDALMLMCSRSD